MLANSGWFGERATASGWFYGELVTDVTAGGGTDPVLVTSVTSSATGNVTITSVNGDIIDTGLAGVKPGGGTGVNVGTGIVTLNAAKGNITLDDPTTEFPTSGGVVFNAKNVTLAPLGGATLVLGAANQTGPHELSADSETHEIRIPRDGRSSEARHQVRAVGAGSGAAA